MSTQKKSELKCDFNLTNIFRHSTQVDHCANHFDATNCQIPICLFLNIRFLSFVEATPIFRKTIFTKLYFVKKWAKPSFFLFIFVLFHIAKTNKAQYKCESIDGVIGTRTQGSRMEGTDETTELW